MYREMGLGVVTRCEKRCDGICCNDFILSTAEVDLTHAR